MPTKKRANFSSPRFKIEVTQEHIDTAVPRDSSHCMIADAIKDAVPNAKYISVDLATIRFTDIDAGFRYVYLTPRRPQAELLNFDQGVKPEPFAFEIRGAHVLLTGNARKAKNSPAELQRATEGGSTPPIRVGGGSPPLGPLQGGAPENRWNKSVKNPGAGASNRTGKRREFGLRAIIR